MDYTSIDFNRASGPPLPGLPGHDRSLPPSDVLHAIDNLAGRLLRSWYRLPELDAVTRYKGVSLPAGFEYNAFADVALAIISAWTPGALDRYGTDGAAGGDPAAPP